jgi:hypothetical protein
VGASRITAVGDGAIGGRDPSSQWKTTHPSPVAVPGADGYYVYDRQTVGGVVLYTKVATITSGTVITVYNFAPGTHNLICRAYSTAGGDALQDSTGVATFTVASPPATGTAIAVTTNVQ